MEEMNKSGVIYKRTDKSQVFLSSYQEWSSLLIYCVCVCKGEAAKRGQEVRRQQVVNSQLCSSILKDIDK